MTQQERTQLHVLLQKYIDESVSSLRVSFNDPTITEFDEDMCDMDEYCLWARYIRDSLI